MTNDEQTGVDSSGRHTGFVACSERCVDMVRADV